MPQLLLQDSRGHVRDAREADAGDVHVGHGDDFRDGGHADCIGAERAERANLGGRLERRSGQRQVDEGHEVGPRQ